MRISVEASTIREAMNKARAKGFKAYSARETPLRGHWWVFDVEGFLHDELAVACRQNSIFN